MIDEALRARACLPQLETPRLLLRAASIGDLDAWAAWVADPVAMEHLGGTQSRMNAFRQLAAVAGSWLLRGYSMFSVIEKSTGTWIGRVGPWMPDGWPGNEVGWGIVPSAWGKGLAFEAASACITFAFDRLGWTDVVHCISPKNARSRALAERLGSNLRGPSRLPAPFDDEEIDLWGQTREQWRSRVLG